MREALYTINGIVLGADPYVITDPPVGFSAGPPIVANTVKKPTQHGAYGGKGWADALPLELSGVLYGGASWATMNAARDALVAACWVPEETDVTIVGEGVSRLMRVRSRGSNPVEVTETNTYTEAMWRVQWEALDPRMYSTTLHSTTVGLPAASGGFAYPLVFPRDYGGGGSGGSIAAANAGSAPAPWTARFDGPLVAPRITHQEQDRTIRLGLTLDAGEFLILDSQSRTALLSGTASRYSSLVTPAWFDLTPGPNTIRFLATSGSGTLTFAWRDAWW
jgi:hypothetical protein